MNKTERRKAEQDFHRQKMRDSRKAKAARERARKESVRRQRQEEREAQARFPKTVPTGPMVDWIEKTVQRYDSYKDMAEVCCTTDRQLVRIRDQKWVKVSWVDEVLTREGTTMLWELYG
jgi:hypothetical protein